MRAQKQDLAMNRVVKKIKALRQTLRKDEREALDSLLSGEVAGHVLMPDLGVKVGAKQPAAAEVEGHVMRGAKQGAKVSAKQSGAAEVEGHVVRAAKQSAKVSAKAPAKQDALADVEGHMLDIGKQAKVNPAKISAKIDS